MSETEPKRGRGRPPKQPGTGRKLIAVRLPEPMVEALNEAALTHTISVTTAVEEAVAGWLHRNG